MKYIDDFIEYLKVIKKDSDYTLINYKDDVLELYRKYNDLLNLTKNDVNDYLEYLYTYNYSRNTISRKLSGIRSFYNYLIKEDIIKNNPFKSISNPKKSASLPKYVKTADLEKMFLVSDQTNPLGQRNNLILEMLYATGIRVSELVNVKLLDINNYDNTIRIMGKGNKMRIVMFGSFCEDALKLYINDGRSNLDKNNSEYLFLNKNGGKLSDRSVRNIINDIIFKCSIDYKVSPHTLRHTFATDMLNNGADLISVKEMLGHSSLNTTSIYTHVSNAGIKKVYDFAHPRAREK